MFRTALASQHAFHRLLAFLILTGQRRGESSRLQWDWIDADEQTITFPEHVTKNKRQHTFPYGELTARLFQDVFVGGLVFPGRTSGPISGWGKFKERLDRESAVTGYTLHDLRRTMATNWQRLGIRLEVTEAMLNHVSGSMAGVTGIYQRYHWLPEMREACLRWEEYLANLTRPTV